MFDRKTSDDLNRFTDSYNLYYSSVFSFVMAKTGNHDEAEDICQEVFSRFYSNIGKVQQARAWLYGTARNVIRDYFKSRGKSPDDIEKIAGDEHAGYTNGFRDARLVIGEIMDDPEVFENDSERTVFDLIAVYGYSYKDAADHTGINYHTVRYLFKNSSKRIAERLKQRGIAALEDLI